MSGTYRVRTTGTDGGVVWGDVMTLQQFRRHLARMRQRWIDKMFSPTPELETAIADAGPYEHAGHGPHVIDGVTIELVDVDLAGDEGDEGDGRAITWPDPNATRDEVSTFVAQHAPPPAAEPAHEMPPTENGPSLVCNACGVVRVAVFTPFCRGCLRQGAGGDR